MGVREVKAMDTIPSLALKGIILTGPTMIMREVMVREVDTLKAVVTFQQAKEATYRAQAMFPIKEVTDPLLVTTVTAAMEQAVMEAMEQAVTEAMEQAVMEPMEQAVMETREEVMEMVEAMETQEVATDPQDTTLTKLILTEDMQQPLQVICFNDKWNSRLRQVKNLWVPIGMRN